MNAELQSELSAAEEAARVAAAEHAAAIDRARALRTEAGNISRPLWEMREKRESLLVWVADAAAELAATREHRQRFEATVRDHLVSGLGGRKDFGSTWQHCAAWPHAVLAKQIIEVIEDQLAAWRAELAAVESEMLAYATAHGLESDLPDGLRPVTAAEREAQETAERSKVAARSKANEATARLGNRGSKSY